jgi:ATP-dependent helicase HrpA
MSDTQKPPIPSNPGRNQPGKQQGKYSQGNAPKAQYSSASSRQLPGKSHGTVVSRHVPVRNTLPEITFAEDLPVSAVREEIAQAIAAHPVVIICGETGSGKTTQLPKICLALGRGKEKLIGHTQPRRLAATSVAKRIAQELKSEPGNLVGYQIRFTERMQQGAWVKLMTDGILLAETQGDPDLQAYDTLIIDEAHERSLNIDFLLGYLQHLLARRPDLKIIITSATIDADRFAQHFASTRGPAPVINVSGRLYPVETRYQPLAKDEDLPDAICRASDELLREGQGDLLVFLPGEREIKDAAEALRKHYTAARGIKPELLPLFARLSVEEQQRVFAPHSGRRIVLATNVAETSLTVPGIHYVIDSGLARVKRYSYRNKVEQLAVEPVSQAAANQRAGRCGRVAAGVCIRLYDEADFAKRPKFTDPEILRSSLASVILRMKSLCLAQIEDFPFIDPPLRRAIADGYGLLQELGALNDQNELTSLGQQLAKLPLDPKVGRILLAAAEQQALKEALIITAALSTQDPRDRPQERQQAADQAHKQFDDEKSEFLGTLKLWKWFEFAFTHKESNRKFVEQCQRSFLNHVRLREWRDVHSQLTQLAHEAGLRENIQPATYEQLHMALLTGLLGNIGCKTDEDPSWLGARGIRFLPHPGVNLSKKPGKWLVAAELVETTRLYARSIANVEPTWIERVGKHLIVKHYAEPRWDAKSGQVLANERGTLYGLLIYHGRRVNYAAIDPLISREIFIREALALRDWENNWPFFAHNARLIREIEVLEHKARRPDFLVDEELLYQFYESQIPAQVVDTVSFDKWYRGVSKEQPKCLFLAKDDILKRDVSGVTHDTYPKTLTFRGLELKLDYHFEPGSPKDGVTMTVPVFALNQVDAVACEWLVPGMLKEKVVGLLKSLHPKARHRVQPVAETAQAFIDAAQAQPWASAKPLLEALRDFCKHKTQLPIVLTDFKSEMLPAHCFMNYRVIDEHGRMLDVGRNLAALRSEFGAQAQASFTQHAADEVADTLDVPDSFTTWSFGELPELIEIERAGKSLVGFPAFKDALEYVTLEVLDDEAAAHAMHHAGLRRLFMLQLKEQVRFIEKNLPNIATVAMQAISYGLPYKSQPELAAEVLEASFDRAFLQTPWPTSASTFEARLAEGKPRVTLIAQEFMRLLQAIVNELGMAQKKAGQFKPVQVAAADVAQQFSALFPKRFLCEVSAAQLAHYPRYLKAVTVRADKFKADPARDARLMAELQPLLVRYQRERANRHGQTDAQLTELRWLLEELRVGLFAQELKTPTPVSVKRLLKVFEALQR